MIRVNRFRDRFNDKDFCRLWQSAASIHEVAEAAGATPNAVKIRASQLRKAGRNLKRFPPVRTAFPRRRLGRGDDSPGLRTDGRHNHKPKSDYCPGVRFSEDGFTELEYEESLVAINDPRTPLDRQFENELTTEIYRRAAAIRAARSTRSTPEDNKRPVELTVIAHSEVFSRR